MDSYELIRFKDNGFELDVEVSPDEDTVWLSKEQMALLFDRDRSVISKHIKKIFQESELDEKYEFEVPAQAAVDGLSIVVRAEDHAKYLVGGQNNVAFASKVVKIYNTDDANAPGTVLQKLPAMARPSSLPPSRR